MRQTKLVMPRLRACLPILCILICVMQPLMDVLSYWQTQLGASYSFAFALRIVMVGGMVLFTLPFVRRKRLLAALSLAVLLYLLGHVFACLKVSSSYAWQEDLADQARLLMFPFTAFCLMVYLRENEKVFPALKTGLMMALSLILTVMLLSTMSGTDPHTYAAKGIGIRGWFFWTSAQSAILSMLCPLAITWAMERYPGRLLPLSLVCLLSFGALFAFGTRLSYASLAASGICMAGCVLLSGKQRWSQALSIFLCAVVFLALYPISPMIRNRTQLHENAEIKQGRINVAFAAAAERYGLDPDSADTASDPRTLAVAYRYCLQGMIDRFGIDRVAAAYENSLNVNRIWDERVRKLQFCQMLMEDAVETTPLARLFGLEIGTTKVEDTDVYVFELDKWEKQSEASDPENDFFGVYYLCGIVGIGMLILFFGYFVFLILKLLWKSPRQTLAPSSAAFLISFGIALVYAWNTVSVLRRNNASFYFAAVLACIAYMCGGQLEAGKE